MVLAFTPLGDYFFGDNGLMPSYAKFPMIVLITTIIWVIVTYVTQPESKEVLQNFYKKIQPGGPGWNKIVNEAKEENIEIVDTNEGWSVPSGIVAMFVGCAFIYSIMFATGSFIYGEYSKAFMLLGVALISGLVLLKLCIESVDLFRGLTIVAMILVNNPGSWSHVYAPLLHAEWHGLTPTDLIFPFFLFIVGISIHLSYRNKTASKSTYKKILIRSLKLFGLGFFLAWFLPYTPFFRDLSVVRIPGVLQRIGLVFLVSSVLYLNCNWKTLLGIALSILLGYWLLLGFVLLPDGSLPTFDRAPNNWAMYIDLNILGEHMWKDDYDPEGLMSSLPAIATCLSGILIGRIIISNSMNKILRLLIISGVLLVIGYT